VSKPKPDGLKMKRTRLKLTPKDLQIFLKNKNQEQRFSQKGRTAQHR
jgi:hypothetical protein